MSPHTTLDDQIRGIIGDILRPGDASFAEAVTTITGTGAPDLVAQPGTTEEVAAAVRYARDRRIPLTVRAGGHSMSGLSTADSGLLLDLRRIDDITIEPTTRIVSIGGGARWGQVASALQPYGLGLTAGDTAGVGVGGLTLGGGIGWMVRRHGLAVDNLVGAEVVTGDGSILEVSAQRHPELFWALRGGGGGLGVVTRFDFRAQEVDDVAFGNVVYALTDPAALMTAWRDAQRGADDRLTTVLSLMPAMGEHPAVAVVGLCFAGTDADDAIRPMKELGTVLSSDVSVRPYAEVLEEHDGPAGMQVAMDNVFLSELDDASLADVCDVFATGGTVVSLRGLGGTFSLVAPDATAFAHRSAEVMVTAIRFSQEQIAPNLDEVPTWAAVAARGTGSYVNFLTSHASAASHPVWMARRLARIRSDYDPVGVFVNGRR